LLLAFAFAIASGFVLETIVGVVPRARGEAALPSGFIACEAEVLLDGVEPEPTTVLGS
jgi:hypothetical protein